MTSMSPPMRVVGNATYNGIDHTSSPNNNVVPIYPTERRTVLVKVGRDRKLGFGFLLYPFEGLVITQFTRGGVMDRCGQFEVGDLLVEVNGMALAFDNLDDAMQLLANAMPNLSVTIDGHVLAEHFHMLEDDDIESLSSSPSEDSDPSTRKSNNKPISESGAVWGDFPEYSETSLLSTKRGPVEIIAMIFKALFILPLSVVLFLVAVFEGLVRIAFTVIGGVLFPNSRKVHAGEGENVFFDALMHMWYKGLLGIQDGGIAQLDQSTPEAGLILKVEPNPMLHGKSSNFFSHLLSWQGTRITRQPQIPSSASGANVGMLDVRHLVEGRNQKKTVKPVTHRRFHPVHDEARLPRVVSQQMVANKKKGAIFGL
eukprot:m.164293 g.164293  ORF g.164293 m.164293 type:complete len:370 (+) comp31333_c0_seq2:360-1469(+)